MGVTASIVEFADFDNADQEGPNLVRLRKADLKRRINGQFTLRYEARGLTSFSGLELVGRFIRQLNLLGSLRRVGHALPRSDFGGERLSLLVLAMVIAGARRVRHVSFFHGDPLVERLCGLGRLPSLHTLGRWLRGFDAGGVKALLEVNERLVGDVIERSGLRRLPAWSRRMRIVVYRKRVRHRTAKNYQLDLFDPNDGYFEYSAIVTNKEVTGRTLWFFMCGRGTHEKVYGELKGGFAFDCLPTQRYEANSAWQVFSIIAFNLMRALQASTAERTSMNRKRQTIRPFQTIQTVRYRFINRAGLLVQPNGRQILDVGNNPMVRKRFQAIENALST